MELLNVENLNPKLNPILIDSNDKLPLLEEFLSRTEVFVVDTEGNITKDFFDRRIRTIQIGNKEAQCVIDLLGFSKDLVNSQGNYKGGPEFADLVALLKKYLETNKTKKVLFNAVFDYTVLKWCLGIKLWNLYDCYIAEQNIYTGQIPFTIKDFWALDDCVARYCGLIIDKSQQKTFDLTSPLTDEQFLYAALDVRLPLAVMKGQEGILTSMGIKNAVQVDCDALPAFCDQHLNGLLLDKDQWKLRMAEVEEEKKKVISQMDEFFIPICGRKDDVQKDLTGLEESWRNEVDRELRKFKRKEFEEARREVNEKARLASKSEGLALLDYESPKQLLEALLKTGIPARKLKDTKDRTLLLLSSEFKVISLLKEFRRLNKLITTYDEPYIKSIKKETGRIHAEFRLIGARTGRPSCAEPNLYNIPKDSKWRRCFIARPGYKMITADFSGQELRIMTELSQEPSWVEAFNKEWDVHSVVAEVMFKDKWQNGFAKDGTFEGVKLFYNKGDKKGQPLDDCAYFFDDHKKCDCPEHKKLRDAVKSINFGIAYGMTEKKLADDLNISIKEAKELLTTYYQAVPNLIKYLERSGKSAKETLMSRTIAGRIRHYIRPTFETCTNLVMTDYKVKKEDKANDVFRKMFMAKYKREINRKLFMMSLATEREGKNAVIQGTGCDMLKMAMGCGFDENGKPFLWHYMDELGMFLENNVYDELLIEVPEQNVEKALKVIDDCMVRAGNAYVKSIPFRSELHVEDFWTKE